MSIPKNVLKAGCGVDFSVADPDYFDTDRDPTISKGNVPESVLFIHLNLIFLVGRSARTQPADISCKIFPSNSFFVLIRVGYGFGSGKMIRIQTDKAVILTFFLHTHRYRTDYVLNTYLHAQIIDKSLLRREKIRQVLIINRNSEA
jgi:hypothetical protein